MAYGSLGRQGFTPLGRMAQAMSQGPKGLQDLPPTKTLVPPDPQTPTAHSGLAEALGDPLRINDERDSNSRGSELSAAMAPSSGGFDSEFIAAEPGAMSVLGLSTGTAYDKLGQGYDTTNLDVGALAGGLVGGLAGPVGGLAGGLLGRQADANVVLGASPNRSLGFGQGVSGMSRGERRAFNEARDWTRSRDRSQTPQVVSGASRAPQFNGQQFGDRGRALGNLLSQAQRERGSNTRGQHSKGQRTGANNPSKSFK